MLKYSYLCLLLVLCLACEKEQETIPSVVPEISFKSLEFIPARGLGSYELLKLKIAFQDVDVDLGVQYDEIAPPYQPDEYLYIKNGLVFPTYDPLQEGIIKIGVSDTLPLYTCNRYRVMFNYVSQSYDTLYMRRNLYNYNILVDVLVNDGSGFKLFESPVKNSCEMTYSGRFQPIPIWDGKIIVGDDEGIGFAVTVNGPYHGELTYNIDARSASVAFKGNTIKLRIKIIDRKLNISNEVETSEISFP